MLRNIADCIFEITCDKCKLSSDWSKTDEGLRTLIIKNGWWINPAGKKYKHICHKCQTASQRRNNSFVLNMLTPQ